MGDAQSELHDTAKGVNYVDFPDYWVGISIFFFDGKRTHDIAGRVGISICMTSKRAHCLFTLKLNAPTARLSTPTAPTPPLRNLTRIVVAGAGPIPSSSLGTC